MDNWTAPKYNNMQHKVVFSGSQNFTRCIPLSKREAKIRNQAGVFVFDEFTFNTMQVNLDEKSGGVQTSLLNIFSIHHV